MIYNNLTMREFPQGFLWGAAISAYQVEGNNTNCDWWEWEKEAALKETSGLACRHYDLYKEDFDLAQGLRFCALRISLEWSRIEPEEGKFLAEAIDHYKDVILSLRERNLEPVVTLHHFTNPLWFSRLGGWSNKKSVDYFSRYVEKIVSCLGDKVKYWVTINEPMVYAYHAYILGTWPPQVENFFESKKVQENLIRAHIRGFRVIHEIYRRNGFLKPCVSIAKNMMCFVPCRLNIRNKIAVFLRDRQFNFDFIDKLVRAKSLDFIGVNYYTRSLVEVYRWTLRSLLVDTCREGHSNLRKNSLGWDIYPEGLYNMLLRLKGYGLPVFILENGICTEDDSLRWDYISAHLESIYLAIENGLNVLGYLHWSLLDNFEWDKGFSHRFGLIEVDYRNYKRTIRESAKRFSLVCKRNVLDAAG